MYTRILDFSKNGRKMSFTVTFNDTKHEFNYINLMVKKGFDHLGTHYVNDYGEPTGEREYKDNVYEDKPFSRIMIFKKINYRTFLKTFENAKHYSKYIDYMVDKKDWKLIGTYYVDNDGYETDDPKFKYNVYEETKQK